MTRVKRITEPFIEGDIDFEGLVLFKESVVVNGLIRAGCVEGYGYIVCRESITSNGFIDAAGHIRAANWIEAHGFIKSGSFISSGQHIMSFCFWVEAEYIQTTTLPLWRTFWAEMKPLRPWREEILNTNLCWEDYRKMLTPKEAKKVCAWGGWHPLLRAHLEMFFGLKDKVVLPRIVLK